MKYTILLIMLVALSSCVFANDLFRFSGTTDDSNNGTIGGTVETCGNNICNSWEDFSSCPLDCDVINGTVDEPFFRMNLIDSEMNGISDNTYENGWTFRFNVSFYHPNATYFEMKLDDFTSGSDTFEVEGNVIMEYLNSTGNTNVYEVSNDFNEPASDFVYELYDYSNELGTQSVIDIKIKIPESTLPGDYSARYFGGIFE